MCSIGKLLLLTLNEREEKVIDKIIAAISDYIQNGNSQMFLRSVFSAHYLDIFYIYMPLTSTVTFFLNLDFLYISSAFLPIHSLHYRQNIHLSKRYVPSRIVFVNIGDIFSIYGMLYSSSSGLQSY